MTIVSHLSHPDCDATYTNVIGTWTGYSCVIALASATLTRVSEANDELKELHELSAELQNKFKTLVARYAMRTATTMEFFSTVSAFVHAFEVRASCGIVAWLTRLRPVVLPMYVAEKPSARLPSAPSRRVR